MDAHGARKMTDTKTYVVHAKTAGSQMSIATEDPTDALRSALEMQRKGSMVTITDRDGNLHTVAELEQSVLSGDHTRPASSNSK